MSQPLKEKASPLAGKILHDSKGREIAWVQSHVRQHLTVVALTAPPGKGLDYSDLADVLDTLSQKHGNLVNITNLPPTDDFKVQFLAVYRHSPVGRCVLNDLPRR